jgi:hypothetical protein
MRIAYTAEGMSKKCVFVRESLNFVGTDLEKCSND